MGQYPITAGVFGKALAIPGTGNTAITPASAWEFENQTGTLGTNYTGSQVYVGVTGDVVAILSDTVGAQDTVTGLNLQATFTGANPSYAGFVAGAGYFGTSVNFTTTTNQVTELVSSLVYKSPAQQPSGLTVDFTVETVNTSSLVGGTGYTAGQAFSVSPGAGVTGTGLAGTIDTVDAGDDDTILTFTITKPGINYKIGDVLNFVQGGGAGGSITLTSAPNGAVTGVTVNQAGTNYSVGDVIQIVQVGRPARDPICKFVVSSVGSLLPVAGDAITFKDLQVGTFLPVAVDYVITCPANSVAVK